MAFLDFTQVPLLTVPKPMAQEMKRLMRLAERRRFNENSLPGPSALVKAVWGIDSHTQIQAFAPTSNYKLTAFNSRMAAALGGASRTAISNVQSSNYPAVFGNNFAYQAASPLSQVNTTVLPTSYRWPNLVARWCSKRNPGTWDQQWFSFHPGNESLYPMDPVLNGSGPQNAVPKIIMPSGTMNLLLYLSSSTSWGDVYVDNCPDDQPFTTLINTYTITDTQIVNDPSMVTASQILREYAVPMARGGKKYQHCIVRGKNDPSGQADGTGAIIWGGAWDNPSEHFGVVCNAWAKAGYMASDAIANHANGQAALGVMGADFALIQTGANEANNTLDPAVMAANCVTLAAWIRAATKPNLPIFFIGDLPGHGFSAPKLAVMAQYPDALAKAFAGDPLTGVINMRLLYKDRGITEITKGYAGTPATLTQYSTGLGTLPIGSCVYMPFDIQAAGAAASQLPFVVYRVNTSYGVATSFQDPISNPLYYDRLDYYNPCESVQTDTIHLCPHGQCDFGANVAELLVHSFGTSRAADKVNQAAYG